MTAEPSARARSDRHRSELSEAPELQVVADTAGAASDGAGDRAPATAIVIVATVVLVTVPVLAAAAVRRRRRRPSDAPPGAYRGPIDEPEPRRADPD